MRSAKFGHGTNSNFMPTPLFAVKSFDSSTSALAGSQAAQHKVIVFGWANAGAAGTSAAAATSAAAPNRYFVMFRLYALSSRHPTILASIGVGLLSETPFTKQGKRNLQTRSRIVRLLR